MKQIINKPKKQTFEKKIKIFLKSLFSIFMYSLCLTLYTLIFLIPSFIVADQKLANISMGWISIPIIGILLGLLQIHYLNTGSLISRTILMMIICLFVFVIPIVISFII